MRLILPAQAQQCPIYFYSRHIVARKRTKIRYCYEDYMKTLSDEEITDYQQRFMPLINIIAEAEDDKAVMAMAKEYDTQHGSEIFAEAVHLTVYCIACSKFDCDC